MTIIYNMICRHTGLRYRHRVEDVASVTDEPYPPGGTLRVCRDENGKILCGPHVDEITAWKVVG